MALVDAEAANTTAKAASYIPIPIGLPGAKAATVQAITHTTGKPPFTGQVTIEGKIADAQTGEVIGAEIDRRVGSRRPIVGLFESNTYDSWSDVNEAGRYWAERVQIQVPSALAGKELTLQPALVEKNYFSKDELHGMQSAFYDQFFNGNWIDPKQLGQLPGNPGTSAKPADFSYSPAEQHRLWQVWIDTSTPRPVLEVEIKYPPGVLQRTDDRGYMFRLALETDASEADRLNSAFSGELIQGRDVVLVQRRTQLVKLDIPNSTDGGPNNV